LKWLEVSLTADGEIAEAAADVLARYAPAGLTLEPRENDSTDPSDCEQVTVRAFLPMDEELEERRTRIEEGLWHLSQIKPFPSPTFRVVEEENWAESWKARYRPIPVGERILIQPSWLEPPETPRAIIYIEPGMAFGSGAHPSTRLSLLAIEEHLMPGHTAIDLGCGTGILSIAAAKLGATRVYALDIDPSAVKAAQENVAHNHVEDIVWVGSGSMPQLHDLKDQYDLSPDIVVANILAPVLEELIKTGLSKVIQPAGKLILSGILDEQASHLMQCAEDHGLQLLQVFRESDWQALVLEK
jgi:ribosomal protein L11 methyltransferase